MLAGGASSRFGSEKALALFRGATLLDIALARLAACARRAVSVAPGGGVAAYAARLELDVVSDDAADPAGPLAGVKAGLAWAAAAGLRLLATMPCDAPLLPNDLLARLANELGDAPAALASTRDGDHPLCALWRVEFLAPLTSSLRTGVHPPVHAFLDVHGAARVRFDDAAAVANANTAAELKRLES